jgi:serine/threonine protein kinase, bacterial
VVTLAAGSSAQSVPPFTGLSLPDGVAVDTAGNVYVADRGHNQVLKLAAGSATPIDLPFTASTTPTVRRWMPPATSTWRTRRTIRW